MPRARRVVIAPDSFKGSIGAVAAAAALADGWRSRRPGDDVRCCPLADGGEGTVEVLARTVDGARLAPTRRVRGPGRRSVWATFLELPDRTAVVELAGVAGLQLARGGDPMRATTHGVGELMAAAMHRGARRLVLTVGGSATTDGGTGAAIALGAVLRDGRGAVLAARGALPAVVRVDLDGLTPAPPGGLTVLTDVTNPLCGPTGAAAVYGPQKGLSPRGIARLDTALQRWAGLLGVDPEQPGLGAAGGTPAPFVAVWGARLASGLGYVATACGFDDLVADADLVITGEGRFDATSLHGKVCGEVTRRAAAADVPVAVVAGSVTRQARVDAGRSRFVSLTDLAGAAETARRRPGVYLRAAAAALAGETP